MRADLRALRAELRAPAFAERIRRHPLLSVGVAVAAGVVAGPILLRGLRSPARVLRLGFRALAPLGTLVRLSAQVRGAGWRELPKP